MRPQDLMSDSFDEDALPRASHNLKLDKQYIHSVKTGEKTCEIRLNDRDYQKGDYIYFDEFGSEVFEITHVLHFPVGLQAGYVALSIKYKKF